MRASIALGRAAPWRDVIGEPATLHTITGGKFLATIVAAVPCCLNCLLAGNPFVVVTVEYPDHYGPVSPTVVDPEMN